jgi:hypothetical protein
VRYEYTHEILSREPPSATASPSEEVNRPPSAVGGASLSSSQPVRVDTRGGVAGAAGLVEGGRRISLLFRDEVAAASHHHKH